MGVVTDPIADMLTRIRNACKSGFVRMDMLEERRAPGRNRHWINQHDLADITTTDEMRSQNRRTSEVVPDH